MADLVNIVLPNDLVAASLLSSGIRTFSTAKMPEMSMGQGLGGRSGLHISSELNYLRSESIKSLIAQQAQKRSAYSNSLDCHKPLLFDRISKIYRQETNNSSDRLKSAAIEKSVPSAVLGLG